MKVLEIKTNQVKTAIYAHNRLGNLRMWVDGKFYSDKEFDKKFARIDPTNNYIKIAGAWVELKK